MSEPFEVVNIPIKMRAGDLRSADARAAIREFVQMAIRDQRAFYPEDRDGWVVEPNGIDQGMAVIDVIDVDVPVSVIPTEMEKPR